MRNLDLPDQSWDVEDTEISDTPEPAKADDDAYRSFHYSHSGN